MYAFVSACVGIVIVIVLLLVYIGTWLLGELNYIRASDLH